MTARVSELPAGLRTWAPWLSALTPDLCWGLAPMLHGLDDLIHRRDLQGGTDGPLDGYDGFTNRGTPDRIALSEWLIADELPLEFLRRAASNELNYLKPAHQRPPSTGRVVLLLDAGPSQLGPPRLAQIAAIVVLARRAVVRDSELVVGLLQQNPGEWLPTPLEDLFPTWRRFRSQLDASSDDVDAWLETTGPGEVWTVANVDLAEQIDRKNVIAVAEGRWGAGGATSLQVNLGFDSIELHLPHRDLALRAMRGAEFRRSGARGGVLEAHSGPISAPTFNGSPKVVLCRGESSDLLLSATVSGSGPISKTKRHSVGGPILAAAPLIRRVVSIICDDDALRVRVIGKDFHRIANLTAPVGSLDLDEDAIANATSGAIAPLFYYQGGLYFRVGNRWYYLGKDGLQHLPGVVSITPGAAQDKPLIADGAGTFGINFPDRQDIRNAVASAGWVAASADGRTWMTACNPDWPRHNASDRTRFGETVVVGENDTVIGLAVSEDEPGLITVSPSGVIVRIVSHRQVRTLTRWSGGAGLPSAHPVEPWIAVQKTPETVEIGNYQSGELIQTLRGQG